MRKKAKDIIEGVFFRGGIFGLLEIRSFLENMSLKRVLFLMILSLSLIFGVLIGLSYMLIGRCGSKALFVPSCNVFVLSCNVYRLVFLTSCQFLVNIFLWFKKKLYLIKSLTTHYISLINFKTINILIPITICCNFKHYHIL